MKRLIVYILPLLLACSLAAQDVQVFFGNLHSHSSYSDGAGKPAEAFKYARTKAKVEFLALTDHNHMIKDAALYTGPKAAAVIPAAAKATVDGNFAAIPGQEFSTISLGNHVNVFDIGQVIPVPNGDFKGLVRFLEANKDTTGQPPIVQFNHPLECNNKCTESNEYGADDFGSRAEWVAQMGRFVRLVEILNGSPQSGAAPKSAEEDFLRILNLGFRVGPTGDQDNHKKKWGNSTPVRTAVLTDQLTKPKVLEALRQRHVYATEDPDLRAIFRVNGHLMGDVIAPPAVGQELAIEFTLHDADEPNAHYEVEVWSDDDGPGGKEASIVETVKVDGDTAVPKKIEDVTFKGKGQYIFFRVRQTMEEQEADTAWTAPVWFDEGAETTPAPQGDPDAAVASKNSHVYHVSADCIDAQSIKPANLIRGAEAREGRDEHQGCPRHKH